MKVYTPEREQVATIVRESEDEDKSSEKLMLRATIYGARGESVLRLERRRYMYADAKLYVTDRPGEQEPDHFVGLIQSTEVGKQPIYVLCDATTSYKNSEFRRFAKVSGGWQKLSVSGARGLTMCSIENFSKRYAAYCF